MARTAISFVPGASFGISCQRSPTKQEQDTKKTTRKAKEAAVQG